MAGFYQSFTSPRTTEPDPVALYKQLRALDASAGVQHQAGLPTYIVKKATAWLPAHITAAQNVIDTAPAVSEVTIAQAWIDAMPIGEKALLLALIDQLNVIRAALPSPLNAITPAQAVQAVRDKAATLGP